MTNPVEPLTPHLYGASELGVLSVTAPGDAHPRVRYIGGDLFVGLDSPDGTPVTQGQAQAWDRDFVDVLLDTLTPGASIDLPPSVDGVITLDDEALAASILNHPAQLPAGTVVWVLARSTVVIAQAADPRGVAAVIALAESLYASEAPLGSIHPIVVSGDEWAPYDWSAATADQELAVHRVIRLFGVRSYEAQTAALTSPALNRPDLHVADPKVHVREDGITVTFAAYPKGTATLLPVTDSVMVADPSGSISVATFDEFFDALGDRAVRTELSPARFFIPGAAPRA